MVVISSKRLRPWITVTSSVTLYSKFYQFMYKVKVVIYSPLSKKGYKISKYSVRPKVIHE